MPSTCARSREFVQCAPLLPPCAQLTAHSGRNSRHHITAFRMQVTGRAAEDVQSRNVINRAYPAAQLQAALDAAERAEQATGSSGPPTRASQDSERKDAAQKAAALRVRQWTDVMHGMATGAIVPGSRQPLKDMPAWVTPEVVKGGIVTGQAAAGGLLRPHEVDKASAAGIQEDRGALAAYYMSDDGLSHLRSMLESGGYKVPCRLTICSLQACGGCCAVASQAVSVKLHALRHASIFVHIGKLCCSPHQSKCARLYR